MHALNGKNAIVTGASRGVGRGVAEVLAEHGARVFVTGRDAARAWQGAPSNIIPLPCDHTDDDAVHAAFAAIRAAIGADGRIDLLVNNVWGGSEALVENGEFTWSQPFWALGPRRWDGMFDAGVRAHYVASALAAAGMVAQGSGLIVSLSYWAAQKYKGNVAYGVAKAATDKLACDMAEELRPHGVASLVVYPGLVRTEAVMAMAEHIDLSNSESPQFVGRAIAALAGDASVMKRSGGIFTAAGIALDYGFADIDGRQPVPLTRETA